ncbi:hypothetical protein [Streptosporangium sp. 'caverna']|nr:hypothetical protein [Streptosporangium sp. 'caverna']
MPLSLGDLIGRLLVRGIAGEVLDGRAEVGVLTLPAQVEGQGGTSG